jgi:hypothetical protein
MLGLYHVTLHRNGTSQSPPLDIGEESLL